MRPNTARIVGTIVMASNVKEANDGKKSVEVALLRLFGDLDTSFPMTVTVVGPDAVKVSKMAIGEMVELEVEVNTVLDSYVNFNGDTIKTIKVVLNNGVLF